MRDKRGSSARQEVKLRGSGNTVRQTLHIHLDPNLPFGSIEWPVGTATPAPSGVKLTEADVALIKNLVSSCIDWCRLAQNPDGGLPTDERGSESCTWGTAGLLWAMAMAGLDTRERWARRAFVWLADESNDDGGMPTVRHGDRSTTDPTSQFLAAASYFDPTDPRASRAAQWLVDTQNQSGGWSWEKMGTAPHTASTCFAILGLAEALKGSDQLRSEIERAIEAAVQWLARSQASGGGWGLRIGDQARASATGLAAHTLQFVPGTESMRRAAGEYLVGHASRNQGWPFEFERASSHTIVRFATPYAMMGLAASPEVAHAEFVLARVGDLASHHDGASFLLPESRTASWPTRDGLLACIAMMRYF
jgi:Squalene-hopene cyclase C-terminal domain/Prenyltransferase and squalene oxidase repeat